MKVASVLYYLGDIRSFMAAAHMLNSEGAFKFSLSCQTRTYFYRYKVKYIPHVCPQLCSREVRLGYHLPLMCGTHNALTDQWLAGYAA